MLAWPGPVNDNSKRPLLFKRPKGMTDEDAFELPCGGCRGCRLDYSREWATRCIHEASCHEQNAFITLTYSPENTPEYGDLCYAHFQEFMKKLRHHFNNPIKFYMCGEYGENLEYSKNGRFGHPHYHALLFGADFADKKPFRQKEDVITYTSELLEKTWGLGHTTTGDVTWQSAAYVARYVMKKQKGKAVSEIQRNGFKAYEFLIPETGEIRTVKAEFTRMSRGGKKKGKGGIGAIWYDKYKGDLAKDFVTFDGEKMKVPKYYDKLLEKEDPDKLERVKLLRQEKARVKELPKLEKIDRRIAAEKIKIKQTTRLLRNKV
jgi:hypothetical protein